LFNTDKAFKPFLPSFLCSYGVKKGSYTSVVNLQIGVITLVTTTGCLVKLSTMQSNGINPLIFPVLVATTISQHNCSTCRPGRSLPGRVRGRWLCRLI
jgi:hypothetical protein